MLAAWRLRAALTAVQHSAVGASLVASRRCWHSAEPSCLAAFGDSRLHHHRACYGVLRFIMESGAKGCEVIVSGKLRAQRAKAMKFKV